MGSPQEKSLEASRGPSPARLCREEGRTIVWLEGEHDILTVYDTTRLLIEALSTGAGGDIVVDLSGVTFMDASTLGVLITARDNARQLQRSFVLRAPSARAARVLQLCDLGVAVEGTGSNVGTRNDGALSSWVPVPTADRLDRVAAPVDTRSAVAPQRP